MHDGVRLLELAKKVSVQTAVSKRKRKLLNFVCSNSVWKDQTLWQPLINRLIFLHLPTRLGKKERPLELTPATFINIVAAHTGLEPVISALRGQRVNRLHQCAAEVWDYRCPQMQSAS